ncbi:MAG: PhoX family phosphatase, partial [Burkholderiales bacterium]
MRNAASFQQILAARVSRRGVLQGGMGVATAAMVPSFGALLAGCAPVADGGRAAIGQGALGFASIATSTDDAVRVPRGYVVQVLYRWGDPIGAAAGQPAFKMDATGTAADQALQAGMHHDGMQFFPFGQTPGPAGSDSLHGLLAMNHEYFDGELLHPDGWGVGSLQKTLKEQYAVGVSVVEATQRNGRWEIVRPSKYARRIHGATPISISGPAAGSSLMRTALDPTGREMLGTFAGCSHGWTPWDTYLSCEENYQMMFTAAASGRTSEQARDYLPPKPRYEWGRFDARFDLARHPNEIHRFGWVVEIDPTDPTSKPVKRTALGRFSHEGAAPAIGPDRRVAWYMGDDQPFEYIYKFVARDAWNATDRAANRDLLDNGTLYVARFNADGSGDWLPLVAGIGPLTAANGFPDQATVLVRTRQAADAVGATKMDRPEWTAVHPVTNEVYCTLTNNMQRGQPDRAAADAANPRAQNQFGHIIRWREAKSDVAATRFEWDIFVLAGDPGAADPAKRGNAKGGAAFGSPDGL